MFRIKELKPSLSVMVKISDFSLKLCEKDTQWVYQILKQEHYELQDVFIMTANRSGEYKIIEKAKGSVV